MESLEASAYTKMQQDKDDLILTENEVTRYIKTVTLQTEVSKFLSAEKLPLPSPSNYSLFGLNNQKAGND